MLSKRLLLYFAMQSSVDVDALKTIDAIQGVGYLNCMIVVAGKDGAEAVHSAYPDLKCPVIPAKDHKLQDCIQQSSSIFICGTITEKLAHLVENLCTQQHNVSGTILVVIRNWSIPKCDIAEDSLPEIFQQSLDVQPWKDMVSEGWVMGVL